MARTGVGGLKPRHSNWQELLNTGKPYWLYLALAVNIPLVFYTALSTLQKFPNSSDEYDYLTSARIFDQGRVSVPSPEPQDFFDLNGMVNNGAYYGKYPPGWPALLTPFVPMGLAWAVNPVLGILTLVVLYLLTQSMFSNAAANTAMALTLVNPYFIFNSASFFSHTSCLLFVAVAAYFLFRPNRFWVSALGFGFFAGWAFLIRPFTAPLVLGPLALYRMWNLWQKKDWPALRAWSQGVLLVTLAFLALYLAYDYAETGHPLLSPFSVYDPKDVLGFHGYYDNQHYFYNPVNGLLGNVLGRLVFLAQWSAGAPFWLLVFLLNRKKQGKFYGRGFALALCFVSLLAGYYFYWGSGGFQYGPRYLYESYVFLLALSAMGVLTFRRRIPLLLALLLVLNTWKFAEATDFYRNQVRDRTDVFRTVRDAGLTNAVVFLQTGAGTMQAEDLTRNNLDFNGPVLLVRELGPEKDREMIQSRPNRSYYVYTFDDLKREGRLEPYREELVQPLAKQEALQRQWGRRNPFYLE